MDEGWWCEGEGGVEPTFHTRKSSHRPASISTPHLL